MLFLTICLYRYEDKNKIEVSTLVKAESNFFQIKRNVLMSLYNLAMCNA